jgi:hypothetical protein
MPSSGQEIKGAGGIIRVSTMIVQGGLMRGLAACALVCVIGIAPIVVSGQAPVTWDAKFRAITDGKRIGEYMKRLSARPHHVGSAYDKDNAEWILERFKEWGWDARIESYDVLFTTPKERLLEMIAPVPFKAALEEPALAVDPTSM